MANVIRSPGVLIAGALLLLAFILALVTLRDGLPESGIADAAILYVSLTLPPTSLLVFFLAGVLAPPAPFLAGALLGLFDALLITVLVLLQADLVGSVAQEQRQLDLLPLYGVAVIVGALTTGIVGSIARYIVRAIRPPRVEVETPPWWPGQEPGSVPTSGSGVAPASHRCAGCGASYAIGSRSCPACGASLPPPPSYR